MGNSACSLKAEHAGTDTADGEGNHVKVRTFIGAVESMTGVGGGVGLGKNDRMIGCEGYNKRRGKDLLHGIITFWSMPWLQHK
jgi:hypothetical protein